MRPVRVMVVDDHRLFRQGLISIMKTRPDLVEIAGEASSGSEAIKLAPTLQPDVMLLDVFMPELDGIETARIILQLLPDIAIVMLTSSEKDEHLYEAVRLGAVGYLLKDLDASELFDLLNGVSKGEAAMTRSMAARLLKGFANKSLDEERGQETLTEREIDVLKLVACGLSNPQIAEKLCITVNTVKSHLKNILGKLNLENRTQVAAYAVHSGLVTLDENED